MSVAALLEARADDGRPVHAGVLLDNVPEFVFLRGGAALAGDAERADCDLVLTGPGHAAKAAELGLPVHDVEDGAHRARPAPRPGRDVAYRRMTAEDAAGLRAEFEKRGRLHPLERSG